MQLTLMECWQRKVTKSGGANELTKQYFIGKNKILWSTQKSGEATAP